MYLRNNNQDDVSVQNNLDGFMLGFMTVGSLWILILAFILCESNRTGKSFIDGFDSYMDRIVEWFDGGNNVEEVYPSGKRWILKRRVLV